MKTTYVFLFAVLGCSAAYATGDAAPYVGFNAQVRQASFKDGYGKGAFAKKMPQGEVYAGFKVNPYLGFELAYLRSEERHRSPTSVYPNFVLGSPVSNMPGGYEEAKTSSKIDGGSVNVVGFLPINEDFQLLGSLGLARLRVKLKYAPTVYTGVVYTAAEVLENTRDFVKSKYIPQAKVGMQYMLTQAIGLKAMLAWEGTSRFNLLTNKQATEARVSLKDSYNVGLGLAYYFN